MTDDRSQVSPRDDFTIDALAEEGRESATGGLDPWGTMGER